MIEQTFAMIKPDAVRGRHIGAILQQLQHHELYPLAIRLETLTRHEAALLYQAHLEQPYYANLIAFSVSGPVVLLILQGVQAVQRLRTLIGATDPKKADPGSIRGIFGTGVPDNAIHGSDSQEAAEREIRLFFGSSQ